jgi:hypothetical protein
MLYLDKENRPEGRPNLSPLHHALFTYLINLIERVGDVAEIATPYCIEGIRPCILGHGKVPPCYKGAPRIPMLRGIFYPLPNKIKKQG